MSLRLSCSQLTDSAPTTRSSDVISSTISALMQEYLKGNERGVFWDDERKVNVDPLSGLEKGFWSATWDLKVCLHAWFHCSKCAHVRDISI